MVIRVTKFTQMCKFCAFECEVEFIDPPTEAEMLVAMDELMEYQRMHLTAVHGYPEDP